MKESNLGMDGRVVLVSGGTGGIGKETATVLSGRGATVIVVGRDEERGRAAVEAIVAATGNDRVTFLPADLSSMDSVRTLAATVRERFDRLDVLVNNAGGLSADRRETVDGFEYSFAMNVLSPFLLTHELLPLLTASAPSRVVEVNTASFGLPWPFAAYGRPDLDDLQSTRGYGGMKAYTRSKTAALALSTELARRLEGSGVTVYAVNPGGADTEMQREARRAFPLPLRLLSGLLAPLMTRVANMSVAAAAVSSVHAATAPDLADETGLYLDPDGRPTEPWALTRDPDLGAELWAVASELTGVRALEPRSVSRSTHRAARLTPGSSRRRSASRRRRA